MLRKRTMIKKFEWWYVESGVLEKNLAKKNCKKRKHAKKFCDLR